MQNSLLTPIQDSVTRLGGGGEFVAGLRGALSSVLPGECRSLFTDKLV